MITENRIQQKKSEGSLLRETINTKYQYYTPYMLSRF